MSDLIDRLAGATLVKAHVKGYTKKDGTVVKDYDTASPLRVRSSAPSASKPPGWFQAKYGGGGQKLTAPQFGLFGGGGSAASKPKPKPKAWHPELNEKGEKVPIYEPHKPSDAAAWAHGDQVAVLVAGGGDAPAQLNGTPLAPWADAPTSEAAWEDVDGQAEIDEPAFHCPEHLEPAAGVVVREPDGRFWLVAPTNGFGGSPHVFPKGRTEDMPLQASAIKEAYEEMGLQVRITGFVGDFNRTQTRTRFYLAERVGGTPAKMGWESQAVLLVPGDKLGEYLTGGANAGVLAAVQDL